MFTQKTLHSETFHLWRHVNGVRFLRHGAQLLLLPRCHGAQRVACSRAEARQLCAVQGVIWKGDAACDITLIKKHWNDSQSAFFSTTLVKAEKLFSHSDCELLSFQQLFHF